MNDIKRPIIVVADDDRDIRELIKMQLTRHGFDVYITDNGETALELADYITKPFSPNDLVQRVNNVINREKRDRELAAT
jgi:DNA-binding response OmpR family regulator